MKTTVEAILFVADYVRPDEQELASQDRSFPRAFNRAAADDEAATLAAEADLCEMLGLATLKGTGITLGFPAFTEFDAANWAHAGAHFEVEVSGLTQAQVDLIEQAYS